jgi:hypothetical protein
LSPADAEEKWKIRTWTLIVVKGIDDGPSFTVRVGTIATFPLSHVMLIPSPCLIVGTDGSVEIAGWPYEESKSYVTLSYTLDYWLTSYESYKTKQKQQSDVTCSWGHDQSLTSGGCTSTILGYWDCGKFTG